MTVDAKRHKCPIEAIKNLKKGFTKLVNWLRVYRKRKNYPDFDYIAVVEVKSRDKKGLKIHIHLHVLFVGIAWLAPSKLIIEKWDLATITDSFLSYASGFRTQTLAPQTLAKQSLAEQTIAFPLSPLFV